MADTVDTGLLPRTYFKAPRVPFDFRALALAMLGYLVYWGGSLLLDEILGKEAIVPSFLAAGANLLAGIPFVGGELVRFIDVIFGFGQVRGLNLDDYTFWHQLVGGIWTFAVWSFFGQAIHRITSLRIARDEGLSFGEAFKFSIKNWVTIALAPVIIALTIAFFWGCDALAGLVISLPFAGQLFALILVPLAMISSLLILLIAIGGILGLPLIGAAAAWERNGSLDAISRAFSYIFARPLQFFWNYFLIFLFVGVIVLVGSWFVWTLTKSVSTGVLADRLEVMIDAPQQRNDNEAYTDLSKAAKEDLDKYREKTGYRPGGRAPGTQPFATDFQTVIHSPWSHKLNALIFWIAINLIWLGIIGYAIYWFLGATTSVYADLRADVDGTEEDEIYIEEEEEDFDALAEAASQAETELAGAEAAAEKAEADVGAEAEKAEEATDKTSEKSADESADEAGEKTGDEGSEDANQGDQDDEKKDEGTSSS